MTLPPAVTLKTMDRRSFLRGCWALALLELGCHKSFIDPPSFIETGDKRWDSQLTAGFYPAEGSGWRWTKRQFSLVLMPPANPAKRGIDLKLSLYIPSNQIEALGPITLVANIDGCDFEPETFSKPGAYTYLREVPPKLAMTNILPIQFSFDRAAPQIGSDNREMAAVVRFVGLQLK